jgi:predicted nucleic acid-binding protein
MLVQVPTWKSPCASPDDLARRLGATGELDRRVLETLALEEYRLGQLTKPRLRRLLGFETDPGTNRQIWSATLRLRDRFGLTAYDAASLELAPRPQLPLATLDREPLQAAQAENVPLVDAA